MAFRVTDKQFEWTQSMFDRLLLPTDGSDAVGPAIETALDIAQTYDATLHILFVVELPSSVGVGDGFAGLDSLLDELGDVGHRATEEIEARANENGIETETAVQQGTPHDAILTYATDHDIDLIVIGTHGRTGIKRALLGSVTENVVRHSEIPVLTVHREPEG